MTWLMSFSIKEQIFDGRFFFIWLSSRGVDENHRVRWTSALTTPLTPKCDITWLKANNVPCPTLSLIFIPLYTGSYYCLLWRHMDICLVYLHSILVFYWHFTRIFRNPSNVKLGVTIVAAGKKIINKNKK